MARITFSTMQTRIERMLGNKGLTTEIGEALNHAAMAIATRNIDLLASDLESHPPFHFKTETTATTGTNSASGNTITLGTSTNLSMIGQLFKYDALSTVHKVVDVVTASSQIIVTPAVDTANTSQDCDVIGYRYILPSEGGTAANEFGTTTANNGGSTYPEFLHCISVTDLTHNVVLRQADSRFFDTVAPTISDVPSHYYITGQQWVVAVASAYSRSIMLYPTPATANIWFQVRYARRPAEISGATNFAPIPEEFDRIIMWEAAAMIFEQENEFERASALRQQAAIAEAAIIDRRKAEMRDARFGIKPREWYGAATDDMDLSL